MTLNEQYLVDVIGFNPVERSMLASIFALAARRDPAFVQYDPNATVSGTADIYLVDAENAASKRGFPQFVNMKVPVTCATGSVASPSCARPRTKAMLFVTR